jgi:NADH-quinone oxidoreductase subunit N
MFHDLYVVAPLGIVGFGALVMMLLAHFEHWSVLKRSLLTMGFLFPAFLISLSMINQTFTQPLFDETFHQMLIADGFSVMASTLIIFSAMTILLVSQYFFEKNAFFSAEFYALLLFAVFGMTLLTMSHELITIFISLEISSFATYVMIALNKKEVRPVEAMLKYLTLGSIVGAFYLFGTLLIYANTGTTNLGELAYMIELTPVEDLSLVILGGSMILITIFFKITAVPFHNWAIDVYNGSSFPVVTFIVSTFKLAIIVVAVRIFLVDFIILSDKFNTLLLVTAIITIVVGSLLSVSQNSIKRMLVASSIVHTGYLLSAILAANNTYSGATSSIIFYLIAYFLSTVGAFGFLSYIAWDKHKRVDYEDFKGFAYSRPIMAACMTVFLLSLVGFPSTIGFLGKFYIFTAVIESGYTPLAVLGILATFVSIYYYFKLIITMYFYPCTTPYVRHQGLPVTPVVICLIAFAILWGGTGNAYEAFIPGATVFIDLAKVAVSSL